MDRPLTAPEKELVPEHQVHNNHFMNSGMTVSAEPRSHYHEGQAELEVLKAILNREGILTELNSTVKKVEKKFQQDIIGLLDLVRQTSLEVVTAIENWRAIKKTYDAAFMWNSVNYLLKMPTDLDYIDHYRAITDWLGFSILRNPFVIPFPMETNPRGMNSTSLQLDSKSNSNADRIYGDRPQSSSRLRAKFKSPRLNLLPSPSVSRSEPFSPIKQRGANANANQDVSAPAIADPMTLVRHAESVILFEEQKYGRLDRDPLGRIVPFDQAYLKYLAINLKKDEHRKMMEETVSKEDFAPHTLRSGVGFASRPWFPGDGNEEDEEVDYKTEEEKLLSTFENVEKNPFEEITRNKQRVGGLLNSLESRAADFRRRYPIQPNHGNDIEFKNIRKVRSLEDTLGSLNVIREKIKAEKESYEKKLLKKEKSKSKLLRGLTEDSNSPRAPPPSSSSGPSSSPPGDDSMASPAATDVAAAERIQSETTGHLELVLKQYVKISQGNSETHSKFFDSAMIPEAELDPEKAYEISKSMLAKEISFLMQLKKYKLYQQRLQDFKAIHHSEIVKERSRDIERKRRLLTQQEAIKRGPPGDEPPNAYDYYATKLQTQVRRWAAIRFVKWFRVESSVASKRIQTRARGMIARVRWKRLKREKDAATEIQRNYRGMACRKSTAAMARDYRDAKAAIKIQTCWRRIMAKKRVVSKRLLDQNAFEAMEAVNPHNLLESDVKELAGWIQLALNEPHEYSFPPEEVLTLLKMSGILLLAGEGYAGLTTYDEIGARFHVETTGFDINWEEAMKLINRSDKYLRRVRGLAYAPISKPPRLITLPTEVISLYKLESQNSKFTEKTFESLTYGSKFCLKLFRWLECMVQVGIVQGKFFDFIGEKFPEWLPKLFDLQKKIRKCEFEILLNEKCLIEIQQVILEHTSAVKRLQKRQQEEREREREGETGGGEGGERRGEEKEEVDHYLNTLEKEKERVEKDKSSAEQRKESYQKLERDYGQEQNAIEIMTMKSFHEKVLKKEEEIKDAVTKYMQLHQLAEDGGGDVLDIEVKLQRCMETITQLTIEMKELKIQYGLLKMQIDNNIQKRNSKRQFTSDLIYHIYQAGEAKATYLLQAVVAKAVLLLQNHIRSEDGLHLHPEIDEEYKVLCSKEKLLKLRYRNLLKLADDEVEEFHQTIISEMKQQEMNEKNDTGRFIPSDEELHVERCEDDHEARVERYAKLLYVSRKILNEIPKRSHPLIIAFTCDVPYDVKQILIQKLHETVPNFFQEISSASPERSSGNFPERSSSSTSCFSENMGLNIVELQRLLQQNQSVIMTVDHGLTHLTRQNFIKNFNMIQTSLSLSSEPLTILIQGDELNQRTPTHDPRYGVYHRDIEKMRDYQIKYSLEKIAYLKKNLLDSEIKKQMSRMYSTLSLPSYAYVIVLEALFILLTQKSNYNFPERTITSSNSSRSSSGGGGGGGGGKLISKMSFQKTKILLIDPYLLYDKLMRIKRGQSDYQLCQIILYYTQHSLWPKEPHQQRKEEQFLHLLASYVEEWVRCEILTYQKGGLPSANATGAGAGAGGGNGDLKIELLNCLSVITVTDSYQSSSSSSSSSSSTSSLFEDTILSVKKSGWMTPLTYLYKAVFHELRVYHTVKRGIDAECPSDLFQVNVYRNDQMIFFDAYNPKTSQCYHTSISIHDVPSLLVPSVLTIRDGKVVSSAPPTGAAAGDGAGALGNGDRQPNTTQLEQQRQGSEQHGHSKSRDMDQRQGQGARQEQRQGQGQQEQTTVTPPVTSIELYQRLVNLLQVRRLMKIKNSKKEMICKRRNVFIKRFSIKICGHNLMLNCYESGMNELYFEGYLPEHSATLIFHLNDVLRLKMLSNCDHLLEYHMLSSVATTASASSATASGSGSGSVSSLEILPYVVDRLRIIPNKAMKLSQQYDYFQTKPSISTAASQMTLKRASLHQGYRLILNSRSGAGKYLIRKTIMFLGIPHVMTLKSSSVTQTLRIIVYEPMAQKQQELRMNSFLRKVILHDTSENYKQWVEILMKKLRLDYHHKRELCLDLKLYQKLFKVRSQGSRPSSSAGPAAGGGGGGTTAGGVARGTGAGWREEGEDSLIITVMATMTEVSIKVTLFHLITCELYECNLSKENVLDLLLFPTPSASAAASAAVSADPLHQQLSQLSQDTLLFLQQRRDYYQTYETTKLNVLMTHSLKQISYDEIPFEEILCHRSCLQFLTHQLSSLLYREVLTDQFICLCSQRTKLYFQKLLEEEIVEEKAEDVMSLVSKAYSRSSSKLPHASSASASVGAGSATGVASQGGGGSGGEGEGSTEEEKSRELEEKNGFNVSFRHRQRLLPKVSATGGSVEEVLARRRQAPVVFLEKHLEELAHSKVALAHQRVLSDLAAAEALMNSSYGQALRRSQRGKGEDEEEEGQEKKGEEEDSDEENSLSSSVSNHSPREQLGGNDESTIESQQGNEEIKHTTSQERSQPNPSSPSSRKPSVQGTEEQKGEGEGEREGERSVGSLGSHRSGGEKEKTEEGDEDSLLEDPEPFNLELFASRQVLEELISEIETKDRHRWVERLNPGTFQKQFFEKLSEEKRENDLKRAMELAEKEEKEEIQLREIMIRKEVFVFEKKLRVNYREGRSRWGATALVGIHESACWDGPEGVGRKLRFVVHDLKTRSDFEGIIRGTGHLRQVLGKHGYDLLPTEKTTEMILFLCRHRLEVVRNTTTSAGEPITAPDAPIYRIEFMIPEDLEGLDKKKTLSEAEEKKKKEEEEHVAQIHARGRKIVRISRRVNGLLLQLVVFQLPMTGFEESSKLTEYQRLMKKVMEDEEKAKKAASSAQDGGPRSQQKKREQMVLHPAPPLRVVAYDPKTKFRDGVIIPPEAVLELAGGGYSPFLAPDRRRELGRVVCESLQLDLLATGGFKLSIPWSGIKVNGRVKTTSFKLPRESISLIRPGRIFHSALRITRFNILVTAYIASATSLLSMNTSPGAATSASSSGVATSASSSGAGGGGGSDVLFHFYSSTCANEIEIIIPQEIQIEYMGQTLLSYLVGESRNIAITNFVTHFFDALIFTNPANFQQKLLEVTLVPKKKGYVISYRDIGLPRPEEDLRSVGIPQIFMPPDATGTLLFRQSTLLYLHELQNWSEIEYLVSIYTKSPLESLERGVVVKVYSTLRSQTMVLHVGPNEIIRLCQQENQMTLFEEILTLRNVVIDEPKDSVEEGFMSLTRKGENLEKMKRLVGLLCGLVIKDIGIKKNSQGDDSLYSKTSPYEPR